MARPPAPPLQLSKKERSALEGIAASISLPHRAVREAKGLLMAGDGVANSTIAETLGVSRSTVLQWRGHFDSDGVEWVGEVHEGRGRKPVITQEQIDQMISDTLHTTPPDATHWSNRTMADHCGLSRTTVQREWQARGIKPHLVKTFKVSNDPDFEDKLIDVVGLYMNPPEGAIVL
jgi:hypothetical protein